MFENNPHIPQIILKPTGPSDLAHRPFELFLSTCKCCEEMLEKLWTNIEGRKLVQGVSNVMRVTTG